MKYAQIFFVLAFCWCAPASESDAPQADGAQTADTAASDKAEGTDLFTQALSRRMTEEDVPRVTKAIASDNEYLCFGACRLLGRGGPVASTMVPVFADRYHRSSFGEKRFMLYHLSKVEPIDESIVQSLDRELDGDEEGAFSALMILYEAPNYTRRLFKKVSAFIDPKQSDLLVAQAARTATQFAALDGDSMDRGQLESRIIEACASAPERVRLHLLRQAWRLHPLSENKDGLNAMLHAALDDQSVLVRATALLAIGATGLPPDEPLRRYADLLVLADEETFPGLLALRGQLCYTEADWPKVVAMAVIHVNEARKKALNDAEPARLVPARLEPDSDTIEAKMNEVFEEALREPEPVEEPKEHR